MAVELNVLSRDVCMYVKGVRITQLLGPRAGLLQTAPGTNIVKVVINR